MIKTTSNNFKVSMQFKLRNAWRDKIIDVTGIKDFPFTFEITNISDDNYLCQSVSDKKTDKVKNLLVKKEILAYLTGVEVETVNVGLYFCDYIPDENSSLLFSDKKCSDKITPAKLITVVDTVEIDGIEYTTLGFELKSLISDKVIKLSSEIKNSWKELHGSSAYMTDIEKMYQDTFIHKEIILNVCNRFADWLENNGQEKDAEILREKAIVHDNSKILNKDEFDALTSIINDKSCLVDASKQLSQYKVDAIELHWKNNDHHPEHFESIDKMSRNNRQEMACDCCARSIQYNTDLLEFMQTRQDERFGFNDKDFEEMMRYCKTLVEITSDLRK